MLTAALLLKVQLAIYAVLVVLLLFIPSITLRVLGLPAAVPAFWPRLTGGLLLAIAVAAVASDQGWMKAGTGLGIGGFIAINLTLAFVLASLLVAGNQVPTRRGRFALWMLAAVMAALGFTQIAFAG